jgi:hypothetical protein
MAMPSYRLYPSIPAPSRIFTQSSLSDTTQLTLFESQLMLCSRLPSQFSLGMHSGDQQDTRSVFQPRGPRLPAEQSLCTMNRIAMLVFPVSRERCLHRAAYASHWRQLASSRCRNQRRNATLKRTAIFRSESCLSPALSSRDFEHPNINPNIDPASSTA